jgi:hypothetical protein
MADSKFRIVILAARDRTTQPPEPGVGTPPPEVRSRDIVLVEVAKVQSDVEYLQRDLAETRTDMRDIRDRMTRLEVRVDHLPSKEFIVVVVTVALTIIGGLLTVAPKLQNWAGTAPTSSVAAPSIPGAH